MIKKAVLPVAGLGTRFLPASKATPKEMLPIIDKPLVQYAVEEAISIGIKEIIFITSPEKNSIKRHFNKNEEIEKKLIKSGKGEIAKKLNPKIFSDITFYYINQETQNGLGDAILHAERIVNNEDFAVLLPDDLIFSEKSCLSQLLEIYDKHNSSVIAVNKVDEENIHKYGVIKPGDFLDNGIIIEDIIEKPSYKEAPSDIAVCGRYILTSSIFNHLKSTDFDKGGEVQLTDAIKSLLKDENVLACLYDGEKFDCGSKKGFVHATIALALRDESINKHIKKIIKEII
ncbi:MAG: UTP--glucose-1-phosphate uridylyltransferase [Gammaproteobacteria bacterium]|nr:UTP--glucose-1-phosphate uridylyltransferase [Gammaproteobacteria bacterium]|tara:strand:+ start:8428 stop:9288 length:861 start_codon:yes stop_codon:yes gene_type:complete